MLPTRLAMNSAAFPASLVRLSPRALREQQPQGDKNLRAMGVRPQLLWNSVAFPASLVCLSPRALQEQQPQGDESLRVVGVRPQLLWRRLCCLSCIPHMPVPESPARATTTRMPASPASTNDIKKLKVQ